ncbi:MAG: hypothetical protein BWZ10_01863 [candidate division BRC1 bacterium ADurb.BinA364]|nr:MAG: hypothetical protein BWZ10_01863 [candidate division BRC1 bacterium ADurb.BinA364]
MDQVHNPSAVGIDLQRVERPIDFGVRGAEYRRRHAALRGRVRFYPDAGKAEARNAGCGEIRNASPIFLHGLAFQRFIVQPRGMRNAFGFPAHQISSFKAERIENRNAGRQSRFACGLPCAVPQSRGNLRELGGPCLSQFGVVPFVLDRRSVPGMIGEHRPEPFGALALGARFGAKRRAISLSRRQQRLGGKIFAFGLPHVRDVFRQRNRPQVPGMAEAAAHGRQIGPGLNRRIHGLAEHREGCVDQSRMDAGLRVVVDDRLGEARRLFALGRADVAVRPAGQNRPPRIA